MKKLLALLATIFLSSSLFGACHTVTPSGAGTNSGADWNNACAGFTGNCSTANLTRGDIYYVGKGTYSGGSTPTFSKANSGSLTITVQAVTDAANGGSCSAGYSHATHFGQAVFSDAITFSSDFWILDGMYGSCLQKNSFGIRLNPPVTTDTLMKGSGGMGNSIIRNVEISGNGSCTVGSNATQVGIYPGFAGGGDSFLVDHVYIYGVNNHFKVNGPANGIIQNSCLTENYSAGTCHGENIAMNATSNLTIRNNYFENCRGTACIAAGACGTCAVNTNAAIYGNIFNATTNFASLDPNPLSSGLIWGLGGSGWSNLKLYNNVFSGWGTGTGGGGATMVSGGSGSLSGLDLENNVAYNNQDIHFDTPNTCLSNSYYQTNKGNTCTGDATSASNPFVNPTVSQGTAPDFHLVSDTSAWTSLGSPYNVDPDGTTRFSSRGAFQFGSVVFTNSPTSIDFGNVIVAANSGTQTVTYTNISGGTVTISSVALIGANPGDFTLTNHCGATLTNGNNCTADVFLTPSTTGTRSATLRMTNTATGSPFDTGLTGNGLSNVADATVSPASVSFGNQTVNTSSSAATITLTNNSGVTLTISNIAKGGTDQTQFTFTSDCGASLGSTLSCHVFPVFSPTTLGAKSASIVFTDNGSQGSGTQTVPLTGTGTVAPTIAFKLYTDGTGDGSVASITTASTLNLTGGDTVVCFVANSGANNLSGLSCGVDTLTFVKRAQGSPGNLEGWIKFNTTANATATCTATWAAPVTFRRIACSSYSGLSGGAVDQASCNSAACNLETTGTVNRTAQNVTTTSANEALVGASSDNNGGTWAAGGSFLLRSGTSTKDYQYVDQVVTNTGTFPSGNFATNGSGSNYISTFFTISAPAGGGPTTSVKSTLPGRVTSIAIK